MPDRDVFDRNVSRGWQTAARRMLGSDDDLDAVGSVIRALSKEVREHGCAGLDQIVGVISEYHGSSMDDQLRGQAHDRLDMIRIAQHCNTTETTVNAGKRLLAVADKRNKANGSNVDLNDERLGYTLEILAELADDRMCPARLLPELIESGLTSFQALHHRRERAKNLLKAAPEFHQIAQQLLDDPTGRRLVIPRIRRQKLSPEEMLAFPLTK